MTEVKEINNELRSMAISAGLCQQWQEMWRSDWNADRMISQFYRGIDFFLKNRFVSNKYIAKNFDRDFLRSHGVIVDDTYSLLNNRHSIILGDSNATFRANGHNVSRIYVTDQSNLKVIAKDSAFVLVSVFGNATVEVEQNFLSWVTVILHSKDAHVTTSGKVKIKENYDYLKKF